jgi:kynurenine formamidase
MPNIQFDRIVDLSHLITTHIPVWPDDPPTTFTPQASLQEHGYTCAASAWASTAQPT